MQVPYGITVQVGVMTILPSGSVVWSHPRIHILSATPRQRRGRAVILAATSSGKKGLRPCCITSSPRKNDIS